MSEEVHPQAARLDTLSTREILETMHAEDRRAVDAIAARLRAGGTLHYFGAGTSGRLAELDAIEIGPTFGVDVVRAHSAGDGAAEDDGDKGAHDATAASLGPGDAVVGVSASGRTAYVLEAMKVARAKDALVVTLSCAAGAPLSAPANIAIEVETGPEVIAGSTRLKAGTVQKVVLNMISTGVFVRLGRTYRGRMVGVVAGNAKLRRRAIRIVRELTGAGEDDAERAIVAAHGNAQVAILILECGLQPDAAAELLGQASLGSLLGTRGRV